MMPSQTSGLGRASAARPASPVAAARRPSPSERRHDAPVPTGVATRAAAAIANSGEPLPAAPRQRMEARFGHDFGAIRVHADAPAAAAARAVSARAFAVGQHIAFGKNEYAPETARGTELLAHELAHTVQQRGAGGAASADAADREAERSAEAASDDVAGDRAVRSQPARPVGLARNVVPLDAYSDADLAKEIASLTESLKTGDPASRDWYRERLRQATAIATARQKAREPAPPPPAPTAPPAEKTAPPRDEAAERAQAVKEAEAVLAERDDDDDAEDTPAPVSLHLGKGGAQRRPTKPIVTRPTTLSLLQPDPRWEEGARVERKLDDRIKADHARIDAQITHDREVSKTPYEERLRLVRLRLQYNSNYWYSYNEAVSHMSGEEVWRTGLRMDLFLESEKKAVYADQGQLVKVIEEELHEKNRQLRAKFESDQYQALVARGEQLSSPTMFVQPFAFAAMGPLIGAAYAGTQTGGMVGQAYNACVKGDAGDCVEAAAPLVVAAVLHRATKSWTGPGAAEEGAAVGTPATPAPVTEPSVAASGENPAPAPVETGEFQVDGFGRTSPARPPKPPTGERQVAGFGREIEPKTGSSPDPTIGFLREPKPPGATPAPAPAEGGEMTTMPPAKEMPAGGGAEPTTGEVKPATGARRDQPAEAMAGKRRVGEEHTTGARGSTEQKHQVGQTRALRQNAAADLRNAASRETALLGRVEQLKAKFERIVKNMNRGRRAYVGTEGVDVETRYRSIYTNELSPADLEEIETLRTQLRRELGIRGSELDDLIIDHLDRLGLLPTPLDD